MALEPFSAVLSPKMEKLAILDYAEKYGIFASGLSRRSPQVELLTKEMTAARKVAETSAAAADAHQKTAETQRAKLQEEEAEFDAIQKRLTQQLKEARDRLAAAEAALRDARKDLAARDQAEAALQAAVARLEGQLRAAREGARSAGDVELASARKTIVELREELAAAKAALGRAEAEVTATRRDLVGLESEVQRGKVRFEEREREWRGARDAQDGDARARAALEERVAALQRQAEADKDAASTLRERIRMLERQLAEEQERAKKSGSGEAEARVLRAEVQKLKETLAAVEKGMAEAGTKAAGLDKKLRAALRANEASEGRLRQVEREREETRAVENAFKMKMKALYDKRVKELEQVLSPSAPPAASSALNSAVVQNPEAFFAVDDGADCPSLCSHGAGAA
jgi:chromosome segregation ATPase